MDPSIEREDQFENIQEQVMDLVNAKVAKVLENPDKGGWMAAKVPTWTGDVVESCLKELSGLNKPFKYAVTCMIVQRNGAGMSSASSCFWDPDTDGNLSVHWEGEFMHAVVSVFAFAQNVPPIEETED
jgi:dynein light chain Tctex-type 1